MSVDTIQIDSKVKVEVNSDLKKILHEEPRYNTRTGMYKYVANINNASEDGEQIYKYSEYQKHKSDFIMTAKVCDANTVRVDLAFDSFDGDYKKLVTKVKYLIMLIANKYDIKNVYECINQWTLACNSVNIKGQYFDVECYNKDEQENKSENENGIKIRLEFRIKKLYNKDKEEQKEVIAFNNLKTILSKAVSDSNISELHDKMLEILLTKVNEHNNKNKVDETLTMYQHNIFSRDILESVYSALDYHDVKQKAKRFIQKKELILYTDKDMKMFVDCLIKTGEKYFQN